MISSLFYLAAQRTSYYDDSHLYILFPIRSSVHPPTLPPIHQSVHVYCTPWSAYFFLFYSKLLFGCLLACMVVHPSVRCGCLSVSLCVCFYLRPLEELRLINFSFYAAYLSCLLTCFLSASGSLAELSYSDCVTPVFLSPFMPSHFDWSCAVCWSNNCLSMARVQLISRLFTGCLFDSFSCPERVSSSF